MILPSTLGFLLENLTTIDLYENETVGISDNHYDLLDKRVFQADFSKNKDGTVKSLCESHHRSFILVPLPDVRKIYSDDKAK